MAGDDAAQPAAVEAKAEEEVDLDEASSSSSSASSSSSESEPEYDSDYSSDYDGGAGGYYEGEGSSEAEEDNSPEATIQKFEEALESRPYRKQLEKEEREYVYQEDLFDFPRDPERWREEDLHELWADAPVEMTSPGWDPVWADDDDWEVVRDEAKAGRDTPIAPFYLPYRKHFPAIPDNHYDISNPRSVIEELDRIEEFLTWVSYVFPDGSTYEGTVWDDLAHGKGVFVAEQGLVRYEGEWLQNAMEGHGVVEVEIPDVEPVPGSKLEAKMRAQGRIISRDFMTPEDKNWLEMDIEDSVRLAGNWKEIPFYERDEWIKVFGQKPEKGRYRYAGQWKHGRMHGCGVYEVNERIIYGRFYFGEHVEEDSVGCDADVSGVHAGIAEVAAAKARMFVNKPDGMVREERGPYGDPQHPYFYEEDDVWMAPGFINQFYEVPDYWKTYVEEVDQEREMWLNSFYKAPLRIPMPAELEYWWSKADDAEFVLINKEPEPDPEDPSKLIYTEDPLIVHTPTGRLINFVEDEEHGVRLFWQPRLEEGKDIDPEKAEFLPLGFDEFYGRAVPGTKKEGRLIRLITAVENAVKPVLDRLGRWVEERKKASELNLKLIEQELDFIEAELSLKEAMEDMEMELRLKQKEEEKKTAAGKDTDDLSPANVQDDADSDEGEDEEAPTSFGTVLEDESDSNRTSEFKDENKSKKSPFSSLSMSLATCNLVSIIPFQLHESFISWKQGKRSAELSSGKCSGRFLGHQEKLNTVKFPRKCSRGINLIAVQECYSLCKRRNGCPQLNSVARIRSSHRARKNLRAFRANGRPHCVPDNLSVLSLHVPISDAFAV